MGHGHSLSMLAACSGFQLSTMHNKHCLLSCLVLRTSDRQRKALPAEPVSLPKLGKFFVSGLDTAGGDHQVLSCF